MDGYNMMNIQRMGGLKKKNRWTEDGCMGRCMDVWMEKHVQNMNIQIEDRWTVNREKMDGCKEDSSMSRQWIDGLKIDEWIDRKWVDR